ncbi:MAG: hypothetical protein KAI81_00790 [Candidatus Marinimicrobia bacterium]|nr:hypothetical protein [Candidatus Neomarinimicrobiota bacterium]
MENNWDSIKFRDAIEIPITRQNLFYMQRQFSVIDHMKFFPYDTVGAQNPADNVDLSYKVKTIKIETDLGFEIETDIVGKRFVFRNRSYTKGTIKYMNDRNVKPGDTIVIEKIDAYNYKMYIKAV